jgi:hypothetical protein
MGVSRNHFENIDFSYSMKWKNSFSAVAIFPSIFFDVKTSTPLKKGEEKHSVFRVHAIHSFITTFSTKFYLATVIILK